MSSKFSSLYQKILKGKDKVSIGPQWETKLHFLTEG
jgi:hypothetical protein